MNKKIKVIELLNKIANGEEVPNKIEYQEEVYEWDKEVSKYADYEGFTLEIYTKKIDLHEEVEILEDNTEEIEEYKGETFEQLGYEVGKMSIAIAKGLEKAIKEMRKENTNVNKNNIH